jgi:hypothetical protein
MTRIIALAFAIAAVAPASASAATGTTSFTLIPSTTHAGASPTVKINTTFSAQPETVTVALAAGLLANPTVPVACTQPPTCGSQSLVGSGKVMASSGGLKFSSTAKLYLVVPQPGEVGRLALVAGTPFGKIVAPGSVTIRSQPDVGADITFANLPRKIGGVAVTITGLDLTINGTVDAKPFTRNPTTCGPANTELTVTGYDSSVTTATSTFTSTYCSALAYAPKLSGSATVSGADGSTALTTTVTQASGQAATRVTQLTIPFGPFPRSLPAGSTVGTATVDTPLSTQPLTGQVVTTSGNGIQIVFAPPFQITLAGTTSLTANGFQTTIANMPDVPLSSVTVALNGGSGSLLENGYTLCSGQPQLRGNFTGQNGLTASASVPLAVSGC